MGFITKRGKFIPDEPGETCNHNFTLFAKSGNTALLRTPDELFGTYYYPWNYNEYQHWQKDSEVAPEKRGEKLCDEESAWDKFQVEIKKRKEDIYTPVLGISSEGNICLVESPSPNHRFAIYQDAGLDTRKFISGEYTDKEKAISIFHRIAGAKDPEDEAKRIHKEAYVKYEFKRISKIIEEL